MTLCLLQRGVGEERLHPAGLILHQQTDVFVQMAGRCQTRRSEVNTALVHNDPVHIVCNCHSSCVYVAAHRR